MGWSFCLFAFGFVFSRRGGVGYLFCCFRSVCVRVGWFLSSFCLESFILCEGGFVECVMFMAGGVFGEAERRRHQGVCIDCGEVLELYMLDLKKGRRVLQCTRCGLYHFYRKDLFGKWKLVKAAKIPDLWR